MDKTKLKIYMKRFGDTQSTLAESLCLSRSRLNAKINERNNAAFTQPEISTIKTRYNLTASEVESIFFEHNVSN